MEEEEGEQGEGRRVSKWTDVDSKGDECQSKLARLVTSRGVLQMSPVYIAGHMISFQYHRSTSQHRSPPGGTTQSFLSWLGTWTCPCSLNMSTCGQNCFQEVSCSALSRSHRETCHYKLAGRITEPCMRSYRISEPLGSDSWWMYNNVWHTPHNKMKSYIQYSIKQDSDLDCEPLIEF